MYVVLKKGLLLCVLAALLCSVGCGGPKSSKVMVTPFVLKSSEALPPAKSTAATGVDPCSRKYETAMTNGQLGGTVAPR